MDEEVSLPKRKRKLERAKVTEDRCAGLSNMQRLRLEAKGEFPERVRISDTIVAYYSDEVDEWIASRIRGCGRTVPRGVRRSKAASPDARVSE
jgi:predicted DNA-binding transcriptional regulator AlpA